MKLMVENKENQRQKKNWGRQKRALPGNRTRVARMGILHDTTTLAVPLSHTRVHIRIMYCTFLSGAKAK